MSTSLLRWRCVAAPPLGRKTVLKLTNDSAEARQPCGAVPGSEVSLGEILGHLDDTTDLFDGLVLGNQLVGLELSNDLLGRVLGVFHCQVLVPICPAEYSH